MSHSDRIFVGIGFGPIQSALFLLEAYRSGHFRRYVVAEVDRNLVEAVRADGGRYVINIAHPEKIERVVVEGVELYDPAQAQDGERLVEAVAEADELATALPSVDFYGKGGDASVASLLAAGLTHRRPDRPGIIYAAENHNHAAEILTAELARRVAPPVLASIQALNTVIGKMSGVIADEATIQRLGLQTLTPHTSRAVLVEAFNRILISRVSLPGYRRGIEVFVEKDDLLSFEEAKLYGHNAIHALIGYLARRKGLTAMSQAAEDAEIMFIAREAFLRESGGALVKKHAYLHDPLFTPAGYAEYADDLLTRMVNPNLNDLVSRVVRDPRRKLGYDDRLFGTMRLALGQGIQPTNMALGAAAAVRMLAEENELQLSLKHLSDLRQNQDLASLGLLLREIWGNQADVLADDLIRLTHSAMGKLAG